MKPRVEIDKLFDMYETFSKGYIKQIAKDSGTRLVRRISGRRDNQYGIDFITVFCGCISRINGYPYAEYEFFKEVTGINTVSYDEYKRMTEINGNDATLMEMKVYSETVYFDISFDCDLMFLGLCMCAFDGKVSNREREHMIQYVPMPSYTDNRRL